MTALLTKAVNRASRLPDSKQDEIAALLIEEMDDEERWQLSFSKSQSLLERMGEEALKDYKQGRTKELGFDEL